MRPLFEIAFRNTVEHEGGYVFNNDDRGGETYRGITRRWYPDWPGWITIDSIENKSTLSEILPLQDMVEKFYRDEFWYKIKGIALGNQDLANLLFDTAVHTGVPDANKFLQSALNFCNRNEDLYKDLKVDGLIGYHSLYAFDIILGRDEVWAVTGYVLLLRGEATLDDLRINPKQEINAVGWIKRLISFNNKG